MILTPAATANKLKFPPPFIDFVQNIVTLKQQVYSIHPVLTKAKRIFQTFPKYIFFVFF